MDVTSTTNTTTTATANSTSQSTAISSDFETFLTMLTAQLKNQDPLNPIESTDYAVQLATFSNVEQQVRTNQLLEEMASQNGTVGMSQVANWVGMDARAAAPARFDGTPIAVTPDLVSGADAAEMVVRDSYGAEVQRFEIDLIGEPLTWAGVLDNGSPVANGTYRFETVSYADGEVTGTNLAETYSRIVEARVSGTRTLLVLDSGAEIEAGEVSALREE